MSRFLGVNGKPAVWWDESTEIFRKQDSRPQEERERERGERDGDALDRPWHKASCQASSVLADPFVGVPLAIRLAAASNLASRSFPTSH